MVRLVIVVVVAGEVVTLATEGGKGMEALGVMEIVAAVGSHWYHCSVRSSALNYLI
jgi:hypothetical protein